MFFSPFTIISENPGASAISVILGRDTEEAGRPDSHGPLHRIRRHAEFKAHPAQNEHSPDFVPEGAQVQLPRRGRAQAVDQVIRILDDRGRLRVRVHHRDMQDQDTFVFNDATQVMGNPYEVAPFTFRTRASVRSVAKITVSQPHFVELGQGTEGLSAHTFVFGTWLQDQPVMAFTTNPGGRVRRLAITRGARVLVGMRGDLILMEDVAGDPLIRQMANNSRWNR